VRRSTFSLVLFLAAFAAASADPLFDHPRLGGSGGPDFKITLLDGKAAMLGGGPAYVVLDGSLWLGLGGWYLEGDADDGLFIGYAGPSAGWLFFPDSIVSVGAWLTAGMGGYVRTDPGTGDRSAGGFLVIEPAVSAFVAITPASRIGIGASYRLGIPVEGTAATLAELSGPSAYLALRYGAIRPIPPGGRSRFSLAGGISQKFAIVNGQIARYDGGYTRLVIDHRWTIGAMGYRVSDGVEIAGNRFAAMESGVWGERIFELGGPFAVSIGCLAGVSMVGYVEAGTGTVIGAPAVLVSPEAKASLVLTDFCRLNLGLALRGAFPVREIPGITWRDVSGPTLSVDLCFGAY
jgi:hypothetical protein